MLPQTLPEERFITLSSPDGRLSLEVSPPIGGSITKFCMQAGDRTINLFRPYDPAEPLSPLYFGSFPLTPFSNRIGHGRLDFAGRTYDIKTPFLSGAHPNHGDGFMSAWVVAEQSPHRIVLTLDSAGDPYSYHAQQILTVNDDGLSIDMAVTNRSGKALPFGTGHHPYFIRTDKVVLTVNVDKVWMSKNMLPTEHVKTPEKWNFPQGVTLGENLAPGTAGDDGTAYIDHCFTGWDQKAQIFWPEWNTRLTIEADPVYGSFVIFVPSDKPFFCAEPVTNVTDGFNLLARGVQNTGTVVLQPGDTLSGQMRFKPELVI